MDDEDPIRLKRGPGAPPDLVRALEALRNGADESARLERVAGKLGPLLDAPAPTMPAKPSAGSASYKLTALKLMVAGLVLLAPVLWMMRRDGSAKPQKDQAPNEVTSVAKPPDPAPTGPVVTPPPKAEPAVPPPDVSAQRREAAPADRDRDRTEGRGQKADARRVRGQGETAPSIASSDPSASPADGADGARASETAHEQSARAAEPTPSPTPAPTPTPTPSATQPAAAKADAPSPRPPPSEAQLLFAARKAMPDDPALALRLLSDHQRHYPEGVFVPEREVLAIEALRGLGRTAEANARLRLFKARYPNSFHLQRLER